MSANKPTSKKKPFEKAISTGSANQAFTKLLDYATTLSPKIDAKRYLSLGEKITQTADKVSEQVASFQIALAEMPYIALIMLWAASIKDDRVFGERYILMMKELLEADVLPHRTKTVAQAAIIDSNSILDAIRCYKKWSLEKREDYASLYCQFSHWASETTFGYFTKAQDPDRQATLNAACPSIRI